MCKFLNTLLVVLALYTAYGVSTISRVNADEPEPVEIPSDWLINDGHGECLDYGLSG